LTWATRGDPLHLTFQIVLAGQSALPRYR